MQRIRTALVVTLFCLLGIAIQSHGATTAYVTDTFEITLRTGPSTDNKIIYAPKSGQPLEVLEVQDDWTHVRVVRTGSEPIEGWVLSRYLISRLPWELKSKALSEENSALKQKLSALQKSYDEVSQRQKAAAANLQQNAGDLQALRAEYESLKSGAAEYLKLKSEYKTARTKLDTLQRTIDELTTENHSLESSQRNRWFATGALVLLCGLLIGVAVGRQYRKKRSYY
jgi:SH3 domain protein